MVIWTQIVGPLFWNVGSTSHLTNQSRFWNFRLHHKLDFLFSLTFSCKFGPVVWLVGWAAVKGESFERNTCSQSENFSLGTDNYLFIFTNSPYLLLLWALNNITNYGKGYQIFIYIKIKWNQTWCICNCPRGFFIPSFLFFFF